MKGKYPLRKPIIFSYDELLWLSEKVAQRRDDLNYFYARGTGKQKRLRGALTFLSQLQRKLWNA